MGTTATARVGRSIIIGCAHGAVLLLAQMVCLWAMARIGLGLNEVVAIFALCLGNALAGLVIRRWSSERRLLVFSATAVFVVEWAILVLMTGEQRPVRLVASLDLRIWEGILGLGAALGVGALCVFGAAAGWALSGRVRPIHA
jgi:hypothetical protein